MGDWTVRLRYHPALGTHPDVGECEVGECEGIPPCDYVVEHHQEEAPLIEVPTFDIEVRYQVGYPDTVMGREGPTHVRPGWRYTLNWMDAHGQRQYDRGFGHQTEKKAKEAAERRARAIALSMIPAARYKYRPVL